MGSGESFTLLLLHQWTAIIIILLLLFSHISVCANQSDRYYISRQHTTLYCIQRLLSEKK